jgi:hypothetical protein
MNEEITRWSQNPAKKIRREYADRWTDTKGYIDRQQGDLISLLRFFFKVRKVG